MWFNLAASQSTSNGRDRNEIEELMIADQIAEAQRLATAWDAAHPR